jgi:hypothetical protein
MCLQNDLPEDTPEACHSKKLGDITDQLAVEAGVEVKTNKTEKGYFVSSHQDAREDLCMTP